ncbi:general amidase GmdA [Aspergillus phoenicis ATCC 13157]|uniref:amidase n=1 Tax=Aspergillus phoenicis ATCC 13157 TaxID=1353007 RepID=A0A370PGP3_ASPPH|nr:general amidase GmdA [Aspergillus phoenicis ATCC 13157]GLA26517.1 hypothetical protein AnigIFM63326_003677 [Aspergillus niger]
MTLEKSPWQEAAEAKRQAILEAIPKKWRVERIPPVEEQVDVTGGYIHQYLSPQEIEITEADAVAIASHTTLGEWSAVEVTEAFCHRAAIAHQLVNCLHEVFFEDALEVAAGLDASFAKTGKPTGPLHGLPISLKDQFHVRGVETTMGYVGWIGTFEGRKDDPRSKVAESELVRELRNLGAVPFCKTSVPTTLMAAETANNIIGYTWNPRNRHLSSGGSSGGEGALIALRGSPAGFGTDIGGSIRVPAAFNGVFGLRPSAGRMPYEGAANSMDGQNTILSVVGPLATSIRSLRLLFKAVLSEKPWMSDPMTLALPWKEDLDTETQKLILASNENPGLLSFGILHHDGVVQPHPPVKHALMLVEGMLRSRGHQVVSLDPRYFQAGHEIATKTFNTDGGEDLLRHIALSGEAQLPQCFIQAGKQSNATEIAVLNVQKRLYQKAFLDYWNNTSKETGTKPIDAIICPVAPHAAVRPGQFHHTGYTSFVNVLDYPSAAISVMNADRSVHKAEDARGFLSEVDKRVYLEYDAEIYHGAPVGIQLIGRRLEEEKVLALAEFIAKQLADLQL